MNARLRRFAKLAAYPAFYFGCFFLFAYWTFPYERLKDRVVAEIEKSNRASGSAQRVEIDSLRPYWLTGVQARGVRLITPRPPTDPELAKGPVETVIDEVHVRLSFLPLFIGRLSVTFGAELFGGSVKGSATLNGAEQRLGLEAEGIELQRTDPVVAAVGAPVTGAFSCKLDVTTSDRKLAKTSGTFSFAVSDASLGDGKSQIAGKLALPRLTLGDVAASGEIKDGVMKLEKLAAAGRDLELSVEGKVTLREPTNESLLDVYGRFKFADAYRNKNDMTRSLLGAPGSSTPPLFELDPRVKASKRPDGAYAWHVGGLFRDPRADPAPNGAPAGGAGAAGGKAPRGFAN